MQFKAIEKKHGGSMKNLCEEETDIFILLFMYNGYNICCCLDSELSFVSAMDFPVVVPTLRNL